MRNSLAVRLERQKGNLRDLATEAIRIAGLINTPVVFTVGGVDILVGTSDCCQDVIDQFSRKVKFYNDTR